MKINKQKLSITSHIGMFREQKFVNDYIMFNKLKMLKNGKV